MSESKGDPSQSAAWQSADELRAPTVTATGKRRWIYPDRRPGPRATIRRRLALVLMIVFLVAPFVTIGGLPLIRLDARSGLFYFAGLVFGFNEAGHLVFLIVGLMLTLFLVTALWGRLWCGYACPQTVFVEWLIRPIEEWLEGKAHHRKRLDQEPLTWGRAGRKIAKHVIFLAVTAVIANAFLAYYVAPRELMSWMTSPPQEHPVAFGVMVFVMGGLYADLVWFREQFCSFLCPYARFQAVMMDEHTPAVAYDAKRGEPRGKRGASGDCIDCELCVRVCPTGIDIRQGLQLECIQCSRCVDACDTIMTSLKRPKGLIRTASLADLAGSAARKELRLRPLLYAILLGLVVMGLGLRVIMRDAVQVTWTRQPGVAFSHLPDGRIANLYTVRFENKTSESQPIRLRLAVPRVELICAACEKPLGPFEERRASVVLAFPKNEPVPREVSVQFDVTDRSYKVPVLGPEP